MAEVELTGLDGGHPLGALAAFGLLRCCEEMEGLQGARLGWRKGAGWTAYLVTEGATPDSLVAALASRQKDRAKAPELNWSSDLKTDVPTLLKALAGAEAQLEGGDRAYADFLASFAFELCADDNDKVEATPFCMTSGQQRFLKEVKSLAAAVTAGIGAGKQRRPAEALFQEALFGPWAYRDPQHSLGWDPSAERLHALRARSPTKESSSGVAAAVWLAFEALPLFPCFLSEGRLTTTGFHRERGEGRARPTYFSWPLWRPPLPLETVRSLLSLEGLAEPAPPARELRARGVEAVFRSERYRMKTQGAYYIFRPAFPCL